LGGQPPPQRGPMPGGHARSNFYGQGRRRAAKPIEKCFTCSLEELYTGCTKKLRVSLPMRSPYGMGTQSTQQISEIYRIDVRPGWKPGTRVKFPPRGPMPEAYFTLQERKHQFFKRRGDDLFWTCKVSSSQTKKDLKINIPHLDGKILKKRFKANTIKHGHQKIIPNYGMPIKGGPQRGNLVIQFEIMNKIPSK